LFVRKDATLHHFLVDVWVSVLPLGSPFIEVLDKGLLAVLVERVERHTIVCVELKGEADAHFVIGH
jgi:hypothetical protein